VLTAYGALAAWFTEIFVFSYFPFFCVVHIEFLPNLILYSLELFLGFLFHFYCQYSARGLWWGNSLLLDTTHAFDVYVGDLVCVFYPKAG
jgi:hypothetical protein